MCGIFGYISKKEKNASSIVFDGLKLLEYRGYDSWGIAVRKDDQLVIKKNIGKLPGKQPVLPQSAMGIGHTRWATHGGVTIKNAHPHIDCRKQLALVHNGIVENYVLLREELRAKGHIFYSETDTEVIVHLVEEYIKHVQFDEAVRQAFLRLQGFNAIVVAYAPTQEIIAVKNGSPLVIGKNDHALYIASDSTGILPHTQDLLFLEDNQLVILGTDISLCDVSTKKPITPLFKKVTWVVNESTKGKFKHFMLKEIYEQPAVLEKQITNRENIRRIAEKINNAYGTYFIGCGSAAYACLSGVYLFSKIAKKHVNFSVGSEFIYTESYLTKDSLLIAVSQSGESIDVVEPVSNAIKKKTQVVAMTNAIGSTLYRMAHDQLMLEAGPEKAVLATKSYLAMLSSMLLLAYTLAHKEEEGIAIVKKSSKAIERILTQTKEIQSLANLLHKASHIYVLGRGLSYPLALEAALKIKESSYIHAEGFAAGELKHGVIALIEKGTPVIVFVPNDETQDAILANAMEVKARGAFVIGIGENAADVFDVFFHVNDCGASSILPHVVFSQLLGYYLTVKLRQDPDKPRNLAKSVVVK